MYLISVYFDEASNKKMERYIRQIAQKTGNTFMTDNRVPPHLTISSVEARNGQLLIPYVEKLKGYVRTGSIQLVSVGMLFPYVMYLTPVLNEYLLGVSQQVYDAICGIPETSISKYYQPMQWLPHITMGKTLTREQMQMAVGIMQNSFVPFEASVVRLGLARTNPHEDILTFELPGREV